MNPAAIWLAVELLKLGIDRLTKSGKYDGLTQEQAELQLKQIVDSLSTTLQTPEELENSQIKPL